MNFQELGQRHVAANTAFGNALLREGIDTMLAGDSRHPVQEELFIDGENMRYRAGVRNFV